MKNQTLLISLYLLLLFYLFPVLNPKLFNVLIFIKLKYIMIVISVIIIFFSKKINRTSFKQNDMFIFLIFSSLLFSVIFSADFVQSGLRYIFTLIILLLLYSYVIILGSQNVFNLIIKFSIFLSVIIVVSSDIVMYLQLPDIYIQGNFQGIIYNSNYLGLLVSLFLIPIILIKLNEINTNKIFYYPLLFNLLFILYETRSRASMFSLLIIVIVLLFIKMKKMKNEKYFLRYSLISLSFILLIVTFRTEIYSSIENTIVKYKFMKNYGDATSTRSDLWNSRIIGIEEKAFIGWGFGINPFQYSNKIKHQVEKNINVNENNTEKGNSFLAILEESGLIIGIFQIILILVISLSFWIKARKNNISGIIFPLIVFASLFHVNFESWLMYFGNFATILLWLIIISLIHLEEEFISKKGNRE